MAILKRGDSAKEWLRRADRALMRVPRWIRRTYFAIVVLLPGVVGSVSLGVMLCGGRLVETDSIPRGLYWPAAGDVRRGAVVMGCLPEPIVRTALARRIGIPAGRCAGGVLPFAKVVAAIAGDQVFENEHGVAINGVRWPWSAPTRHDGLGRPLRAWRRGQYTVPSGELLVLGLNPDSYDGRYFGPVAVATMRLVYRPLWVEHNAYAERLRQMQPI